MNQINTNRGERRRLKKALKLPFTPSKSFHEQYVKKMIAEQPTAEAVKVRLPRAFEGQDGE